MQLFYRRPLALVCAAFMAVSLLAFYISFTAQIVAAIVFIAVAVCAAVLLFALKKYRKICMLVLALAISALAALAVSYSYFALKYLPCQEYVGKTVRVDGVVISKKYETSFSSGYKLRVSSINGEKNTFVATLDCGYVGDLSAGDRVAFSGIGESIGYGGDDSSVMSEMADGYMLRFVSETEEDCVIAEHGAFDIEIFFSSVATRLSNIIRREVGDEEGDLIIALLLGDRDGLSYSTVRNFSRAGVSHLLALSGLHMAIVMGVVDFLMKRLQITKSIRCVLLLICMASYLCIIGFPLSACRAAIMLAMVYISYFFSAQSDSITSLFIAGVVIISAMPTSVLDIGFWLSFTATAGIILGVPIAESFLNGLYVDKSGKRRKILKHKSYKLLVKILKYIVASLAATLAANAACSLIVWISFGEISLWTPITNLIMSLPIGAIIFLTVIFALVAKIPIIGNLLATIIRGIASVILNVLEVFARTPGSVISLKYDFAGIIIILLTVSLLTLALINVKRKWICALPIPAAILAFIICFSIHGNINTGKMDVSYLQNGKNEMIVATHGRDAVIFDMTDGGYSNIYRALETASDRYATDISGYVITHYHQRHISTVYRLICSEYVKRIWLPYPQDEREYGIMWSIAYYADKYGCQAMVYDSNEIIELLDAGSFNIDRSYIKRSTHPILMLSIKAGDKRITYVGASAHESTLYPTIQSYTNESQYVIFGVHGPITKSQYSYALNDRLRQVIWANNDVISYFRCKTGQENILASARLVGSPQKAVITLIFSE